MISTLTGLVVDAARRHPDALALRIGSVRLTYAELLRAAAAAAAELPPADPASERLVLVWASHSPATYVAILAALLSGRGWVPLHPGSPDARLRDVTGRVGVSELLVDEEEHDAVAERLRALVPGLRSVAVSARPADGAQVVDVEQAGARTDPDQIAYVLFTSGSTGRPKGVAVRHRNAVPLISYMVDLYGLGPQDVCSQMFELSFDLSVHSVFTTWAAGACLAVPEPRERMVPGGFIRESGMTVWYSAPSVYGFMRRLGQLKPAAYPHLRAALFCGEVLTRQAAQAWRAAAPNAVLDNHYGPTEAAMSVTGHRITDADLADGSPGDGLPIGRPYPAVDLYVVDEELVEVPPGEVGELLLGGVQVADGYWRDAQRTAEAFVPLPGVDGVVYRTGDRVRRPAAPDDPLLYVGRRDNQVKVFGYRVELGEVEAVAREELGLESVAAVPWPPVDGGYGALQLFVGDDSGRAPEALRARLATRLPDYMLPKQVHVLPQLPHNDNGKIDRPALRGRLEQQHARR